MVLEMADNQPEMVDLQNLESLNIDIVEEKILEGEIRNKINLDNGLLNIIHFNIRSIHKNFNEFLIAFETYNIQYFDIVILQIICLI